ncbi:MULTISPECIES: tail fiber domain-containing protein [unclassified Lysobacter]|uniref:tail fiber domain-containing protein n=1 Tax=unclassified Lysobacter TaxID=2635362 RepID=UPI001BEA4598|nr:MULTISPECIES: tail fiber domain-containing protein [unclassified Lysobacter]MBT2748688.1 tail fiber domain-containing protein [Lysobacter sp. ISL-42]MBT2751623.1 tail fiber domain-containing protein [Lysobacter sp. ISL-50]MBT2775817.1 tail fiber domain-containing protein [Lysobacter sp. ISL-54]MBT2782218.1 tail fiber domain-containing protein [Lysobacter sp. ISL-52]
MSSQTRDFLKGVFKNGDRPDASNFTDLIDSCMNKASDGLNLDSDGTLLLARGLRLGDSGVANIPGGLRFNGGQLQVNNGAGWSNVGGGGSGGFAPVAGFAGAIAYSGGRVGIGTAAAEPAAKLEVALGANTGPAEQVRFGNAMVGSGGGPFAAFAVYGHRALGADVGAVNASYALRQSNTGVVHLNAAAGQVLSLRQNGTDVRLGITGTGKVVIGGESELAGSGGAALQVAGSAFKNDGTGTWAFTSDSRVKEDVRDLDAGLAELRRVRPVRYRYNGLAGTRAGLEGVGLLGQEIEKVLPETVERLPADSNADGVDGLRVFNPSALTYVLINAVKQLADKVEALERALGEARTQAAR